MKVALVCFVVLAASTAQAQPAVPLSVDEAIARGLASSARIAESRAREAAAAAARQAREALGRPTAQVQAGYVRTNHVDEFGIPQANGTTRVLFPDIPDNLRVRAEVWYPVFTSGRLRSLELAGAADEAAARADVRAVEADLALEIAVTYWQLVSARASIGVLVDALSRTDAWVRDVRARVDAGVSAPHEVPQATALRARQRVLHLQATQAATQAERELVRLTGLPAGSAVHTTSRVEGAPAEEVPHATLVAAALANRAERDAMTSRQQAFRAAAAAALAATRPQVAALVALEPSRPNARFVPRTAQWKTSWDLGVSATWSVWDGGRAKAERAGALAQAQALVLRQREFDSRLEVEIAERLSDIETGRAAVSAATEAVDAAQEVHRVIRVRFDHGVATATEVLDAHVSWLEAALEVTRLHAALRLAESRLRRATGSPLR